MNSHIENIHGEGRKSFKCETCNKTFQHKGNLRVHIEAVHEGKKPFECDICNLSFSSKRTKILHTKRIHNETPSGFEEKTQFKSNISSRKFLQKSHNEKASYECHECDSRYQSKKDLINHVMKTHVEESQEQKDEKLLNCKTLKVNPETVHEGKKPFECDICNSSFATEMAKVLHATRVHNETPSGHTVKPQFKCNICKSKFSKRSHLDKHLAVHDENDSYECDICDSKYQSKKELIGHVMKFHVGESPEKKEPEKFFKCEKCDATFPFHYKLKSHAATTHEVG